MSTARGFTEQKITTILMFWMWRNLEAHILANHAAFISLALIMQLLLLTSRFGPACFGQGKRRAARNPLRFSRSVLRHRSLGYRLNHASCSFPVTAHAISDYSVSHVPCRATGVPAGAFIVFPRSSRAVLTSCFPADLFGFVVAFQLLSQVQVGVLT
jgi:hypothetical protein